MTFPQIIKLIAGCSLGIVTLGIVDSIETTDEVLGPLCRRPAGPPPYPSWCRKGTGCLWLRPPSSPGVAGLWPLLSVAANVPSLLWLLIAFPICLASLSPMAAQAGKDIRGQSPFSCADTGVLRGSEVSAGNSWEGKCTPALTSFCVVLWSPSPQPWLSPWPLFAEKFWKEKHSSRWIA